MSAAATPSAAQPQVLIVEDDAKIADMLANYLQMQGFATFICANGLDAVSRVRTHGPAVMLLDLMLPGLDGLGVCRAVRAFSAVPIIMVTARIDEIDRLLGLDIGADDYICKPFSPREVVARIKSLLRRSQGVLSAHKPGLGFEVKETNQQVEWCGQAMPLTPVEFRLLRLLLSRPGQVYSRAHLLDCLHVDFRETSDRAIDSHVKNLRRKLEQAGTGDHTITSVYGVGYRYEKPD